MRGRAKRFVGAALLVALAALAIGLLAHRRTLAPKRAATKTLSVELSGCGAIRRGGRCLVAANARFRIVVPSTDTDLAIERDGRPVEPRARTATFIELGDAVGELTVRSGGALVRIPVERLTRPAWFAEATAARTRGDLDAAEAATRSASSPSGPVEERALALGLLARVSLRRGQTDEAAQLFRQSIALGRQEGLVSESADDAFALSYLLHQRARRFGEARAVLDDVALAIADYPDGRARERFYRAELAWETGDARTALHLLADARRLAESSGLASVVRAAGHLRAMVLCQAGSIDECRSSLAVADRELAAAVDATPCERVEVAVSLGFADLSAALLRQDVPADLGSADERALAITACPDSHLRGNALEHLALASALQKKPAIARARLAEARAAIASPRLSDALFWTDVEGRIASSEGKYDEATAAFAAEERLAEASDMKREAWRARVGRADALEQKGDLPGALAAYRAAEHILDDQVLVVPLAEGRSAVSTQSQHATSRAIELALRARDDASALYFVRSSRARLARSVARGLRIEALSGSDRAAWDEALAAFRTGREEIDRDAAGDWMLSATSLARAAKKRAGALLALRAGLDDALARSGIRAPGGAAPLPLHEGELGLAFVELRGGRVGFAFDHLGVVSARLGDGGPERMLEPFAEAIERAHSFRVHSSGRLADIDWHAVVLAGRPLLARGPVVYPLDLGVEDELAATAEAPPFVLVVADPTGDLPAARSEAREVAERARGAGRVVLLEDEQATSARVRASLGEATALHYSGHGTFGGAAGTSSALPLAAGGSLAIADVLALPKAPRDVVLSGCETARSRDGSGDEGVGLAQAFVLAGARSVVAPTKVVRDDLAREIALGLLDAPAEASLAERLRHSQLRAQRRGLPGWESYRALAR